MTVEVIISHNISFEVPESVFETFPEKVGLDERVLRIDQDLISLVKNKDTRVRHWSIDQIDDDSFLANSWFINGNSFCGNFAEFADADDGKTIEYYKKYKEENEKNENNYLLFQENNTDTFHLFSQKELAEKYYEQKYINDPDKLKMKIIKLNKDYVK